MVMAVYSVVPTKMVMLLALMLLLQIWITAGSECGLAPTVILNCTDQSAHVEWVASQPGCQYDCKAHWICVNGIYTHKDESSDLSCNNAWDFSIPWDHYFCNVTVFYKYDITIFESATSPPTIQSCLQDSIELQYDDHFEVGRPHEINCILYTGKVVNSDNGSISWNGPNGDIANESDRITVIPTTSDGHIHTSTLQFSYISDEDKDTSYNCTASLSGEHESLSESFTMRNLNKCGLAPNVTLNCNYGSAHVEWVASIPGCQYDCKARWTCKNHTNTTDPHEDESSIYTCDNAWDFSIPWDHYFCKVTVFYWYIDHITLWNLRSPDTIKYCSGHSIAIQYDDYFEVGSPHEIYFILYTGEVTSSDNVSISWNGPNGDIANESSRITVIPATSDGHIHTSTLEFSYISEEDENTSYNCTAFLSVSGENESLSKSFTMRNLTIPDPNVSVTALDDNPIVGKSFSLECNVTVVKGVTSNVDIIWTVNDTVNKTVNNTGLDMSLKYKDEYQTPVLRYNGTVYRCKAVINGYPGVESNDTITINNIKIDHPQVRVTARGEKPVIGKSFSMECYVTVAKGIIGSVTIRWTANDTVKSIMNHTLGDINLFSENLNISELKLSDNNTVYYCEAMITSVPLNSSDNYTLTIGTDTGTLLDNISTKDSSFSAAIIMSSVAAVITFGFIVCFIGFLIYKGKRKFKYIRTDSPNDEPLPMVPLDDNYTVRYGGETSTIDYEYLKSHDKMKKWLDDYLDMPTVDEERSSIRSPSITDERMLDYIHGHSTKEHNTNPASIHDTGYYTSTDNYNTTATTKNDTGYYSDSTSESVTHENGSYITEKAAFHKPTKKTTYISPQEESHLNNVIEEEGAVQYQPSQSIAASSLPSYIALETQHYSYTENATETENDCNNLGDYIAESTTSDQHTLPPFEVAVEENSEDTNSPMVFDDYVPYTAAKTQPTTNSVSNSMLLEEKCRSGGTPAITKGEYLHHTTTVNECDSSAMTATLEDEHYVQQNHTTSMKSVKKETPSTDNLPYITLNEDSSSSHAAPHTHDSADRKSPIGYNAFDPYVESTV